MKNSLVEMFNFSATHNNVECIESLKKEDRGTKNQYWFTAAMLADFFEVPVRTLRYNIENLLKLKELNDGNILPSLNIPNGKGNGAVKTSIYNLEVLNKIGMLCFLNCDKAKEIRNRFSDVLITNETSTNNHLAITQEDQLLLKIIHTTSQVETAVALNEYKLFRDEKEHQIAFERDEAIRTKAYISSKREATLMGKVGGTTKALNIEKEKNNKLLKENIDLIKEKDELKIRLSESEKYKTVKQMTGKLSLYLDTKNNKNLQKIGKIVKEISLILEKEVKKVDDVNFEKVNSYHVDAWKELFIRLNHDPYYLIEMRK